MKSSKHNSDGVSTCSPFSNLDRLFAWIAGVLLSFILVGKLDVLHTWVWKAQAKAIYESRTSTWGGPRFWPDKKN